MSDETPKVLSLVPRLKPQEDTPEVDKPIEEITKELLDAIKEDVGEEQFKLFDQAILIMKNTDSDNTMYTYYNMDIPEIIGTLETVKLAYFLSQFSAQGD